MVGIRQNNLRTRLFKVAREYPLYRRLRADGHVYGRFNVPVRRMQDTRASARFGVGFNKFKRKVFVVQSFSLCFSSFSWGIITQFLKKRKSFCSFAVFVFQRPFSSLCTKNAFIQNIHNVYTFMQKIFKNIQKNIYFGVFFS
jgi:hypothetical protein